LGWIGYGASVAFAQMTTCALSPAEAPRLEVLQDVDLEHVRLELEIDPELPPASGRSVLTLRTTNVSADSVRLIAPGMRVLDVISEDLSEPLPFRVYGSDTLVVDLRAVRDSFIVSRELIALDIGFQAAQGIQFEKGFAWTIDPLLLGGAWFPWSGDPSDRFTSELMITVPSESIVSTSGTPLALRETEDGRVTHLASSVEPHTADDLIFAAGPYVRARSGFRVETLHQGSSDSRLGTTAQRALGYFESELESPYPYGILSLTVIPGAGETISGSGLVLIPEDLVDELEADLPRYSALKVVDAVADQWFGSLLSARSTSDRWLESGLTAYLAAVYAESEISAEAFDAVMRELAQAYFDEQLHYRRALTSEHAYHPMQLNDEHARAKGAWVAHSLRSEIGDNEFWETLALLVSSNQFSDFSTGDLVVTLDSTSDDEQRTFFETWVDAPGNPEPVASYSRERDTLFVTVEQQQIDKGVPEVYELQIALEVGTLSGSERFDVHLDELRERTAIVIPADPRFVVIDPDSRYLMRTSMEQSLSSWIAQLRTASTPAGRLAAAGAIARRRGHPDVLLGLRSALSQEASPYVKASILDVISTLSASDAAERALLSAYEDTSAIVRRAALQSLGTYTGSPSVEALALRAANSDSVHGVQGAAVEMLARIGSSDALDVARAALITPSPAGIIQRAGLRALRQLGGISGVRGIALEAGSTYAGPEQPLPVRLEAIHLLETLASNHRPAENALLALLESGNWHIRLSAAEALLRLGNTDAVRSHLQIEPVSWLRFRVGGLVDCL
jgi:aminopeptidase N